MLIIYVTKLFSLIGTIFQRTRSLVWTFPLS